MNLIYTRQSLLDLKNLGYQVTLDNRTKQRIKNLITTKKFRSKRGNGRNGRNKHEAKSSCRALDRNSGVHWEAL